MTKLKRFSKQKDIDITQCFTATVRRLKITESLKFKIYRILESHGVVRESV